VRTLWQHTVRQSKLLLIPTALLVPVLWSYDYLAAAVPLAVGLVTLGLQLALIGPSNLSGGLNKTPAPPE
jgi:hypothetical protein